MLRILLLTAVTSVLKVNRCSVAAVMEVQAADFEVFGRVQGVFFRKVLNMTIQTLCFGLKIYKLVQQQQWPKYKGTSTTGCVRSRLLRGARSERPSLIQLHCSRHPPPASSEFGLIPGAKWLLDVDFEMFGNVQGGFIRTNTKRQADMLGIRGWVMNTQRDTVIGHMQGPVDQMRVMMEWLQKKGSPASVIEKTEFRNQKSIRDYTFTSFEIRQDQDPAAYD